MGYSLTSLSLLVLFFLILLYRVEFPIETDAKLLFECIAGYGLGGSTIAMFDVWAAASTRRLRMLARILLGR